MKPSKHSGFPAHTFQGKVRLVLEWGRGAWTFLPKDTRHLAALMAKNNMLYVNGAVHAETKPRTRYLKVNLRARSYPGYRGYNKGRLEVYWPADLYLIQHVLTEHLKASGALLLSSYEDGTGVMYYPPESIGELPDDASSGDIFWGWDQVKMAVPDLWTSASPAWLPAGTQLVDEDFM